MKLTLAPILLFACAVASAPAAETPSFPPTKFPEVNGWGHNIQRTMRLPATSAAEKRNTVRILFHGQSIAHGLPNTKHALEISGNDKTPIAAFRVYRPPLAR